MKRKMLTVLLLVLLMITAGCRQENIPAPAEELPASYMITAENYFDYQDGLQCSGYASAYALRSMGVETDGLTLYGKIENKNADGTVNPDALCEMLEKEGYDTDVNYNCTLEDLKRQLLNGIPVVVLVRVSPSSTYMHYTPVVGYDEENIYISDSLTYLVNTEDQENYNRIVSIKTFEDLWDTNVVTNLYVSINRKTV